MHFENYSLKANYEKTTHLKKYTPSVSLLKVNT